MEQFWGVVKKIGLDPYLTPYKNLIYIIKADKY